MCLNTVSAVNKEGNKCTCHLQHFTLWLLLLSQLLYNLHPLGNQHILQKCKLHIQFPDKYTYTVKETSPVCYTMYVVATQY